MADQRKVLAIISGLLGLFGGGLLVLKGEMDLVLYNRTEEFVEGMGTTLGAHGVNTALVYFSIAMTFITAGIAFVGIFLLTRTVSPSRKVGALLILAMGALSLVGSFIPVVNVDEWVYVPETYIIHVQFALVQALNFLGPRVIGEPSGVLLIAGVLGLILALKKE